jgi:hypothetical protein
MSSLRKNQTLPVSFKFIEFSSDSDDSAYSSPGTTTSDSDTEVIEDSSSSLSCSLSDHSSDEDISWYQVTAMHKDGTTTSLRRTTSLLTANIQFDELVNDKVHVAYVTMYKDHTVVKQHWLVDK